MLQRIHHITVEEIETLIDSGKERQFGTTAGAGPFTAKFQRIEMDMIMITFHSTCDQWDDFNEFIPSNQYIDIKSSRDGIHVIRECDVPPSERKSR